MRIGHDVVPCRRWQRAASHALGWRIIVIAHPNGADEIARIADEPGITPIVGSAGLAAGRHAVELGAASGSILDDGVHHLDHIHRYFRTDYLLRLGAVTVETPHQFAGVGTNLKRGMRRH